MNNGESIGIDFGTTKTLVCRWDKRNNRPVTIRLGRSKDEIPTSIHHDKNGQLSFGDDAEDLRNTDSAGYIGRIKRDLGANRSFPLRDGRNVNCVDLIAEFLRVVRKRVESDVFQGGSLGHVVITVPALYGPAARSNLNEAITKAGFNDFSLLNEPIAGGYAFLQEHPDFVSDNNLLVFDWGGGTLDLAVVQNNGENMNVHTDLIGGDPLLGGEDIDDQMQTAVDDELNKRGLPALANQPDDYKFPAIHTLVDGKILLSRKLSHMFRLRLTEGLVEFEWKREDFEVFISEVINRAISRFKSLQERINASPFRVDGVVLIGGTSSIPVVGRRIENDFGLKTFTWEYSKEAVGLGAAIMAYTKNKVKFPAPEKGADLNIEYQVTAAPGSWVEVNVLGKTIRFLLPINFHDGKVLRLKGQGGTDGNRGEPGDLLVTLRCSTAKPSNATKSVEYYQKAADQGNADAQLNLGYLYMEGKGVPQSFIKGIECYQRAADQGNADAQFILGYHYMEGKGVPQISSKGVELLLKASKQGHLHAQHYLNSHPNFVEPDQKVSIGNTKSGVADNGLRKAGQKLCSHCNRNVIPEFDPIEVGKYATKGAALVVGFLLGNNLGLGGGIYGGMLGKKLTDEIKAGSIFVCPICRRPI